MPRRLYVPNVAPLSGIQAGLPALWTPHSSWEVLSANPLLAAFLAAPPGSVGSPVAPGTGTADQDRMRFALGVRLGGAGTLGGTLKGQMAFRQLSGLVDGRAQALARIVSGDGAVERGVLLAHDTGGLLSEFLTNGTGGAGAVFENRAIPRGGPQALTPVPWQHGDWLIVEGGHRNHGTNTNNVGYHVGGEIGGGDLPEDETTQVTGASGEVGDHPAAWFEFSQWFPTYEEWKPRPPRSVRQQAVHRASVI